LKIWKTEYFKLDEKIAQLKNKDIADDGNILDDSNIVDNNDSADNDDRADDDNRVDDNDDSVHEDDLNQEIAQLKDNIRELEEKPLLAHRQLREIKKRTSDLENFLLLSEINKFC